MGTQVRGLDREFFVLAEVTMLRDPRIVTVKLAPRDGGTQTMESAATCVGVEVALVLVLAQA
jgi:hypothetical protein